MKVYALYDKAYLYLSPIDGKDEPSSEMQYSTPQPAITCSKLTIETLEQGVKYVQN